MVRGNHTGCRNRPYPRLQRGHRQLFRTPPGDPALSRNMGFAIVSEIGDSLHREADTGMGDSAFRVGFRSGMHPDGAG